MLTETIGSDDGIAARVRAHPDFQILVRRRGRLAWALFGAMLVAYFGFVLLVAYQPDRLAVVSGAHASLGIILGFAVILFAIVLTGVYVAQANARFDTLTAQIVRDVT